jgi:hypothetical protein
VNVKKILLLIFAAGAALRAGAFPLYSPSWGFFLDLPEDYALSGGDRKNSFSFASPDGALLELAVYPGGGNPEALARDVLRRLNSSVNISVFEYRNRRVVLMELSFAPSGGTRGRGGRMAGWGLCVELDPPSGGTDSPGGGTSREDSPPILAALSYGPEERQDFQMLHFSILDSIAPGGADRLCPGAITDFTYPRETRERRALLGLDVEAWFYAEDAEAAQSLVDREFKVLARYQSSSLWKEAWARFYRAVFRDAWERLADAAFNIERRLNVPAREDRDFASQILSWVQSFKYERDLLGSDFVNLVSAALEGRGDCDSRAMLWALVLNQADIHAGIMVSREYSHAMGLAELEGPGAHFPFEGKQWLVAETTAKVSIGLIGEPQSEIENWLGISLIE